MFLHSMDWGSYDNFVSKFTSKRHQQDIAALVAIGRADHFGNVGNPIAALEHLEEVERLIQIVDLPQALLIRYLTSRSYMLKMKGKGVESEYLLSQAVQLAANEQTSNATAYCLSRYALVTLLHDIAPDGTVKIPDEATWNKSEMYCLQAVEQHQKWVHDMDDEFVVSEAFTKGFFLMSFTRYVAVLLRSCTGPGFGYFEDHRFPKENLELAAACIERIKSMDHLLSTKVLVELYLVECDFCLRCASVQKSSASNKKLECYQKAKIFANKAKCKIEKYKDRQMAKFHGSFPKIRLKYIESKLADFNPNSSELSTLNYQDEDLYLSYVEYIKDGTGGKVCDIYTTKDINVKQIIHNGPQSCPFVMVQNTIPKQVDQDPPTVTEHCSMSLRLDDDQQTVPK